MPKTPQTPAPWSKLGQTDIKEELKNYVGADLLFAQMDELKTIRAENAILLEALTALVNYHRFKGKDDRPYYALIRAAEEAIKKTVAE